MTRLILTRHGHVDWIAPERFRGRAELPLSELGQRQAKALASSVAKNWMPHAIYSSPLSRCVDTAEAIASVSGAAMTITPELADINYGDWQGLTHDEVRARWAAELRIWLEAPEKTTFPRGESLDIVLSRTRTLLDDINARHRHETVVLVGHDSVNRVLLLHALGLPLSRYWRIKQEPCCINEFTIDGNTFTLFRANETGHLGAVC